MLELKEALARREEYLTSGKQTGFADDDHLWAEGLDVNIKKLSGRASPTTLSIALRRTMRRIRSRKKIAMIRSRHHQAFPE